eukprot:31363-Pelagococcus_subviridis.AAC.19
MAGIETAGWAERHAGKMREERASARSGRSAVAPLTTAAIAPCAARRSARLWTSTSGAAPPALDGGGNDFSSLATAATNPPALPTSDAPCPAEDGGRGGEASDR